MYNNDYQTNGPRAKSALEVSIRARAMEKQQALIAAQYKAEQFGGEKPQRRVAGGLLANLLTSLRIF